MPDFDPNALGTPNRGTSEYQLDQWNQALRASAVYQDFMQRNGLPTNGRVRLSRDQQASLERQLQAAGFKVPDGMHIDQGGNLNQKNRLVRNAAIGAGIAGAAATGFGLAGMGPFSGLAGAGSASVPGAVGASSAPLGGGTVTGGTLAATPFTSLTPYAGTVAASGTGAGGAALAGSAAAGAVPTAGNVARKFAGLTTDDWLKLAAAGTGTVGALTSKQQPMAPGTETSDPNIQKLLASMQHRLDRSEPLFDSIMSMANGLLPTQYQRNGGQSNGYGTMPQSIVEAFGGTPEAVKRRFGWE